MLVKANMLLLAIVVGHGLDHILNRQTTASPAIGIAGLAVTLVALALALRGSTLAWAVTAFNGFAHAIGLIAIHLLPHWGRISDPLADAHTNWISWVVVLVGTAVALLAGLAGLRARPAATAGPQTS